MINSLIESLLLAILVPLAGYKIWRFSKKFLQLATEPLTANIREALEKIWAKN